LPASSYHNYRYIPHFFVLLRNKLLVMEQSSSTPGGLVSLGRANTGSAFVLQNDNRALNIVMQQDRDKGRMEAAKAKLAQQEKEKAIKQIGDDAKFNKGKVWYPVEKQAEAKYTGILNAAVELQKHRSDPTVYGQKKAELEQMKLDAKGFEERSMQWKGEFEKWDEKFKDKRYNQSAKDKLYGYVHDVHQGKAELDPEAFGKVIGVDDYNVPEIVSSITKDIKKNISEKVTNGGAGGFMTEKTAASNFYELGADGRIVRDKKTNEPVLKITDELVDIFDGDEMAKNILDDMQAKDPNLSRKDAVGQLVKPYAYGEEKEAKTYNRPLGGSGSGSKKKPSVELFENNLSTNTGASNDKQPTFHPLGATFSDGTGKPVKITYNGNWLYDSGKGVINDNKQQIEIQSNDVVVMVKNKSTGNLSLPKDEAAFYRSIEEYSTFGENTDVGLYMKGRVLDKEKTLNDWIASEEKRTGVKPSTDQANQFLQAILGGGEEKNTTQASWRTVYVPVDDNVNNKIKQATGNQVDVRSSIQNSPKYQDMMKRKGSKYKPKGTTANPPKVNLAGDGKANPGNTNTKQPKVNLL
jgi:hypothetical protein